MDTILQADIFFFISSIFVIALTVVLLFAGWHLVRMLRNFHRISETLKNAVEDADGELRQMGEDVRDSQVFRFIFGKKRKIRK